MLGNDVKRDSESIATNVCSQIGRKWNAMFASHVVTSVDRTSFYFLFEDFLSAVVNNHLLCYWPIIQNSISKICPKFQVLSSHFFKVDELLNEQWAKIVLSENISSPVYVECNKMHWSKVCAQEFWYFVSGLDVQLEQSKNYNPVYRDCRLQNTKSHILFFSVTCYNLMA